MLKSRHCGKVAASPAAMLPSPRLLTTRRRGVPARLGSLLMLLQRSPLVKLLPEARVISTSGFSDALSWAVTAIAGLGAFDSVSGATDLAIVQTTPVANSPTVTVTGGSFLSFRFDVVTAVVVTIATFEISGPLPTGLVQSGFKDTKTDFLTGVPVQTGTFPVTITAWEFSNNTGRSISSNFTIVVTSPPQPQITAQPAGGNFHDGDFVSLLANASSAYSYTWKKNDVALPVENTVIVSSTAPRRFLVPTVDPGTVWRSGSTFNDSAWRIANGGIGYDVSTAQVDYLPHIDPVNGNVQSLMRGTASVPKPTSALIRIPFTMTGNTPLSTLSLRVKTDDGFAAWINGTEVAAKNKPTPLLWNSASAGDAIDAEAIVFRSFNLNSFITTLRAGENILAIQAMNAVSTSSDFLFNCELVGGIEASNTRRLIIPAAQSADAGSYTLTVTNSTGAATSDPAVLVFPPSIETHPLAVSIISGATATLTVEAATSPPWTYQWYRGEKGDTTQPVAGAGGLSFTTSALTQTTKYWVRITNPAGSVDSNAATVTVTVMDSFLTWKDANFTPAEVADPAISGPDADPDGDGTANDREYIFGTPPKTSEPAFAPGLTGGAQSVTLTFTARKAAGPGYAGRARHYAIETTGDVTAGPWTPLPLYTDIIANDQVVTAAIPAAPGRTFCRLRVTLTP